MTFATLIKTNYKERMLVRRARAFISQALNIFESHSSSAHLIASFSKERFTPSRLYYPKRSPKWLYWHPPRTLTTVIKTKYEDGELLRRVRASTWQAFIIFHSHLRLTCLRAPFSYHFLEPSRVYPQK